MISLAITFILTSMAVVTVGYQQEPQVLVVTDDTNQETQYFQLPQRVVVLEPGVALLMRQWQRENLIVATTDELKSLFPSAENLGPAEQITVLQLAATRPDLIIAGTRHRALIEEARTYGYASILVRLDSLSSLMSWPAKLGSLLAAQQQAAQTTRLLEKEMAEFANNAQGRASAGRRVIWLVDEQYTVAGRNTLEADLLELIGAVNVGAVFNRYVSLEPVEIAVIRPQIIIAPEALLPILQAQAWPDPDHLPQFIPMTAPPDTIGWHDVFSKAEDLMLQFESLPEEDAQGAKPSAGD